jgi:hypothetical protein
MPPVNCGAQKAGNTRLYHGENVQNLEENNKDNKETH